MTRRRRTPERRRDVLWVVLAVVFLVTALVLTVVILRDAHRPGGDGAAGLVATTTQAVTHLGALQGAAPHHVTPARAPAEPAW